MMVEIGEVRRAFTLNLIGYFSGIYGVKLFHDNKAVCASRQPTNVARNQRPVHTRRTINPWCHDLFIKAEVSITS